MEYTDAKVKDIFVDFIKGFKDGRNELKYRTMISSLPSRGGKSIAIDYPDLLAYNTDLAVSLAREPELFLKAFDEAALETLNIENPVYGDKMRRELHVRIRELTDRISLRGVTKNQLNMLIQVAGMVTRTSELRPLAVTAAFRCSNMHLTRVEQSGAILKKPIKCEEEGCGETRNFELDDKETEFVDFQVIRIQEMPEELPPGQLPQSFDVHLVGDVVNTARPGDRIVLSGIVKAEADYAGAATRLRLFSNRIEANYVEQLGKRPEEIEIGKEEEEKIRAIAASPGAYDKLIQSVAPAIFGHELHKEASLLLMVGSPQKILPDGSTLRGDVNILLVGDPGTAKSELLKYVARIAPRGLYTSGRGTTAAGLTAAVVKEKNGMMMLEAGATVLADLGIACIDEFDKMRDEDRSALHEVMEQQSYHPATEIALADGRRLRIGEFVEEQFEQNKDKVVAGKDCEILPIPKGVELYSCDLASAAISRIAVDRVSKHKAPANFVAITYANGRSLLVTPEHPVFVCRDKTITTVPADEVTSRDFAPVPRMIPNSSVPKALVVEVGESSEVVQLPSVLSAELARLLGYLSAAGHSFKGSEYEICFASSDASILFQVRELFAAVFTIYPSIRTKEGVTTQSYSSKPLYEWFAKNFAELMKDSRQKRASPKVLGASVAIIREFLCGAFMWAGSVESTTAVYFSTASPGLAEDYQDLLHKLGILSRIVQDRESASFKLYIVEYSIPAFIEKVVEKSDMRFSKLSRVALESAAARSLTNAAEREPCKFPLLQISEVKLVPNEGDLHTEWVYDVTVEPTHNFVSKGVLLHNTASVAKGGIIATLNARTSIFAAANPVDGKYDPYKNILDNVALPVPLMTRFDIIFIIRDEPDLAKDETVAKHILDMRAKSAFPTAPPIEFDLLKKYIIYAKKLDPELTEEARNRLSSFYIKMRRESSPEQLSVTPRWLEALVRLSIARARVLLHPRVSEDDALHAVNLMERMLQTVAVDQATKKVDIGVLYNKPISEKGLRETALEVFKRLSGEAKAPVEDKTFYAEMEKTGKFNREQSEKVFQDMWKSGVIYESKPHFFKKA